MAPPPKDEAQPRILPLVDIQKAYQARDKIKTKEDLEKFRKENKYIVM